MFPKGKDRTTLFSMTAIQSNSGRPFSCLLVEDEPAFAEMLAGLVREEGGDPTACSNLAAARNQLAHRSFDLVVLDNHLPDGRGFDFYFELAKRNPAQTIVVLTGLPELSDAVQLTRHGLFDYLAKPVSVSAFTECLQRARTRLRYLRADQSADELVVDSGPMREVAESLQQAARHGVATVLLTGETGSGKDVAARALHRWTFGDKADSTPYIAVNCASMPADMFEAELFGSERGAYTGADKAREGLVGATKNGTLFLDEIGEIPLPLQAKLLRFLEAREYRSLGSTSTKQFAGRVVAATNRDLKTESDAGRFRADLWYRLDSFVIRMPPLRERRDEIPTLAQRLIEQLASKYGRRAPRLKAEELRSLAAYDFPGNVRELRNLLERSLLRTPPDAVWLALDLAWLERSAAPRPTSPAVSIPSPTPVTPPPPAPVATSIPPLAPQSARTLPPLEAQEYEMIHKALVEANGGIRRAAERLGISHQALLRRLQKWPELRGTTETT